MRRFTPNKLIVRQKYLGRLAAKQGRREMPDHGYLDGDPPSLASFILGSVVVGILFMVIKSCIWG
jgi:hypothetical protein